MRRIGARLAALVTRTWYAPRPTALATALRPLAWLFGGIAGLRRTAYRRRWLQATAPGAPVVVVGNITVGGTGKTPLVIALAEALRARGLRAGVLSRGYGRAARAPRVVRTDATPADAGDEPLLIARAGIPVVVGADRLAAAAALLAAEPALDVLLADDGLQHYRLARAFEIAVIDGARALGNGL